METVNSRVAIVLYLFLLLACIYYAKSQESRKCIDHLLEIYKASFTFFLAECMYQYLEQPPVDIICDPYNSESTGLTLQCQVLADGPSSSYSVGWFYYPTNHTGTTPPRPLSVTSTIRDNVIAATSVVTITLTLRPLVDGSSPGFYYCQVLPDDQSETIPSDNFTLYAPEDNHYLTFVLCESMAPRYKNEVKCAVPMGQNAPRDPTEIPPNDGVPNTTTRNVSTTTTIPQSDDAFPTSEAVTNSTTVTCTENGAESDSSQNSSLMLYQIIVFVLTPVFLVILIVLIITIAVCLGRKCAHWSTEQHKKAEENRTRGMRRSTYAAHIGRVNLIFSLSLSLKNAL